MKHTVVGREDRYRSFFYRNPRPPQRRRIRSKGRAVEGASVVVVLDDQRAAVGNVIEQLLAVGDDVFLRVVGADAEDDGVGLREIFGGDFFGGDDGEVHSDLLEDGGNVAARALDVAELEVGGDFYVHDADMLDGGLEVVSAADVFA